MNSPRVSIGLPVHNGERYLRRAVDSILAQDYADFELIISDNASTDATPLICREYALQDRRVRFYRNETNIGAGPNHNRTFDLARGQFFSWAAHDIEMLPGMLNRCVDVISQAPTSVVLVYPRCQMIDEAGAFDWLEVLSLDTRDPRPPRRLATVLHHLSWVNQFYGLTRVAALRKTRLMDSFASSDYVLLAELAMLGEIWEIPEVLTRRYLDNKRGVAANRDRKAWANWIDPRAKTRCNWLPVHERLTVEYLRSAWRIPVRRLDRLQCLFVTPYTCYRRLLLRKTGPLRSKLKAMASALC